MKCKNIFVLGATGTAGSAVVHALVRHGHAVTCFVRSDANALKLEQIRQQHSWPKSVVLRAGDVTDIDSLRQHGFKSEPFDVLVSCLASRTGSSEDAWAVDYRAHCNALKAAKDAGVQHMILLSAICVQKPLLAFQHAKLAFEKKLTSSGLTYSIVRPTAFFKSLSGQVDRVRRGKSFLVFGNGELTSCKPISDHDLGEFIAACVVDQSRRNKILPIGGPGPAFTPREQGEWLFQMTGNEPRFFRVPVGFLNAVRHVLHFLGRFNSACAAKAELANVGHYYATESMLVLDQTTGRYDADKTPTFGTETLQDFHASLLDGSETVRLGEHAVFDKSK